MSTDFACLTIGLHEIAHKGGVRLIMAISTGILLKDWAVAFEQVTALLIADNCTIFRVLVRFSTMRTRMTCKHDMYVSVPTTPLIITKLF